MSQHPEFANEQAYLQWAYECLESMRDAARLLQYSVETGPGGTHQARFERDVVEDRAMDRLARHEKAGHAQRHIQVIDDPAQRRAFPTKPVVPGPDRDAAHA